MRLGISWGVGSHRLRFPWAGFLALAFWLIAGQAAFAAVSVNPSTLPAGTLGVAYDETVVGNGGTGPYTFAITSGALPPGITLDGTTGDVSGTPTAQGVYSFTIAATDSLSATGSRAYTTSVGTFSLAVQPNTLPNGTLGVAYNQTLTAVGGNPPYTFTISSGSMPTGVTLSSGGAISGTPSAGGTFTFIVQAQDTDGNSGFRTYNVSIGTNSLTIAPSTLPNGTQGSSYSQTVTASGGTGGPYTYSVSAGALPSGLSLNASNGQISGTPSAGGSFSFTIRALDANNNYGTQNYTVLIGSNSLTINPSSLPNGTISTAYSQTVTASGGTGGPYTYSVTSGALPTGLSLNAGSGAITGTPTAGGAFSFTIHAVDGNNNFGDANYTVNIGTNSLTVNPASLPGGTQGVAYSQTVSASGGTGPYTYAVSAGALPTGLSLNGASGVISGTPTASGSYGFTIKATDANANFGSRPYTVNIAPVPLTVNPSTLPNGTQGVAYNQTITTSGGTGPFTYAVTIGALPTGLTLNSGSGAITGTPTAGGSYNITVQSTDSTSNTGTRAYAVNIGTNSLTVNPASLPNGTQGVAYNRTIAASGGTAPYTYAITSGALPAGLSLNASSGAITGTPGAAGASSFTIQATDTNGNTGSRPFNVSIGSNSLTVNPASLPNGTQGTAYNQTVAASGGTAPYTYALTSGALPTGLSLNAATGAITGTPSAAGASAFTIQATDANGNTGSRAYNVNIGSNSLTVNPASLPNGTQGVAYNQTVAASGGTGPYTYAVTSGALPAGLSLNAASGAITGTPSAAGASAFTIQATDANGNTGSRPYSVNMGSNSLTVNPASLPNGTQSAAYSQTVVASGGTAPYTYAVTSGSLPAGLSLNAGSGAITGTPSSAGASAFTIQATDANGNTGSRPYNVNIGSNSLTVNPATLPNGTQGIAYNQTIAASGGTAPYTYAVTSGALPGGLSLNAGSGAVTGTPSSAGASAFTVQATDANGNTGSRPYNVNIGSNSLTVNPASLPNGTQGVAYNQTIAASGGTAPYTYAVTSGALPGGLSLNAGSGAITGTPSAAGAFALTIQATDANGNTGSRPYNVSIGSNSLTVNPATLPNGTQGVAYNQTIAASGGTASYTYAVTSGALPAGLSLNAGSGAITGTPSAAGVSAFSVQATDANGNTGSRPYNVNIGSNSLTVNPASLPNGTQGVAYSQTVSASGGTGPYTHAITSGALPAGLSLNSGSGAITGTPSAAGASAFTILATDANGNTGSRPYNVNIGSNSLTVNPASLPNGTQGAAYNQTVAASGGTAPYSYAIGSGALPAGLLLNAATGAITGTPTNNGSATFSIKATDANGNTGSRTYAINIGSNSLVVNAATLPNGSQGSAYTQTVAASGGTAPYTYAITSGALPAGLSLNAATGAIMGTPTGSGPSTFTIRATDANGNTGTRTYSVNIGSNSVAVNPATLPPASLGKAYTQALSATGGTGPYTYSLQSGSLPPGLVLAGGAITGTPSSEGSSFAFVILVRDANGNFGTRSYALSTSRSDPTNDPEVRGLVAAQAATARRFTDAQTTNVMRRLEGLHDGFNPCGLNFGINASTYSPPPAYPAAAGMPGGPPPINKDPYPSLPPSAAPTASPLSNCDPLSGPPIAVWANGAMDFGRATNTGLVDSTKFTTSGVTAGIDARVTNQLIVGGAVGFGADHTDIGLRGTVSSASNVNGIAYASFKPLPFLFIDGLVGYGSLNFDNRRWVTLDGSTVSGKRDGNTWFASLSVSYDFKQGIYKFSPYARLDAMSATLNQYTETGNAFDALTFQAANVSSTAGVIGLRGSVDIAGDFVTWTPNARVEYKRAFDHGFTQSMFYSQAGAGGTYAVSQDGTTRDIVTGAIGVRARFGPTATLELEYSLSGTPSRDVSWQSQMIRAMAHWNFEAN